jgi:prophage antirepressor-like protein
LADSLLIQKENGMELPDWVDDELYKQIRSEGTRLYQSYYRDEAVARLWSGPLLHQMRVRLAAKAALNATGDPSGER